jgi:hypothetical protein
MSEYGTYMAKEFVDEYIDKSIDLHKMLMWQRSTLISINLWCLENLSTDQYDEVSKLWEATND